MVGTAVVVGTAVAVVVGTALRLTNQHEYTSHNAGNVEGLADIYHAHA